MLTISEVLDGEQVIAIEFTDGKDVWFYDLDQTRFAGMRIGPYPHKSLDQAFAGRQVATYAVGQSATEPDQLVPPP